MLNGKRQEEQDVVRAQRREIEAALAMAEIEFKRQTELLPRASGTRKDYEQAESQVRQLRVARCLAGGAGEGRRSRCAARRDRGRQGALIDQDQANLDAGEESGSTT